MMRKIFLTLLTPLTLVACANSGGGGSDPVIPVHDYSEVEHLERKWETLFSQPEDHYYLYCYGVHCRSCHKIKNEVIEYALHGNKTIYFCAEGYVVYPDGDVEETLGKTDIMDVFIIGTPSILEVKNGVILNNGAGGQTVLEIIKSEDGSNIV